MNFYYYRYNMKNITNTSASNTSINIIERIDVSIDNL